MAKLIPNFCHKLTNSYGEIKLYNDLKANLPNDFIIIHSLPILAAGIKKLNISDAPTGEIDFLIISPLGILSLEVKSGVYQVKDKQFIHLRDNYTINPVQQIRKNTHALAKWLGQDPELRFRIGYAVIFPDSQFNDEIIDTGLVDTTTTPKTNIYVDKLQYINIEDHILEIMQYWKKANNTTDISDHKIQKLIRKLCPEYDGTPSWAVKITCDNQVWLPLTNDQHNVVVKAQHTDRLIVTGWPGTGKTLIAIECAKQAIAQGKKILILTYNVRLANYLETQLNMTEGDGLVTHWHHFCRQFADDQIDENPAWYNDTCSAHIKNAIEQGKLADYDLLILDEAQTLRTHWCEILINGFANKQIIAFCDETQVFDFEKERITLEELCLQMGGIKPFQLTIALRSPKIITDHLQKIYPPSFQISSRHSEESDKFQQKLTPNIIAETQSLLTELLKQGVNHQDIVILVKSKNDISFINFLIPEENIECEVVSRYRGLESPIVIVYNAEKMTDKELFSACSRATTACFALYEIKVFLFKRIASRFHQLLIQEEKNQILLENAKKQALTKNIINHNLKLSDLELKTAPLTWCDQWQGWFLKLKDSSDPNIHWIGYLQKHYNANIYFYEENFYYTFNCRYPNDNDESNVFNQLRGQFCNKCQAFTPHDSGNGKYHCLFCSESEKQIKFTVNSLDINDAIKKLQDLDNKIHNRAFNDLPLELIGLNASRVILEKYPDYRKYFKGYLGITFGSYYPIALVLVMSQIFWSPTENFTKDGLAQRFYNNYRELQKNIELHNWEKHVAAALNVCCKDKKILKKDKIRNQFTPSIYS